MTTKTLIEKETQGKCDQNGGLMCQMILIYRHIEIAVTSSPKYRMSSKVMQNNCLVRVINIINNYICIKKNIYRPAMVLDQQDNKDLLQIST